MRTTGVIGIDVNGGGGIYISPTSLFWDEMEERRDRYGCLKDKLWLICNTRRHEPSCRTACSTRAPSINCSPGSSPHAHQDAPRARGVLRAASAGACRSLANTELRCDRAVDSLILSADAASSMLLPFDRLRLSTLLLGPQSVRKHLCAARSSTSPSRPCFILCRVKYGPLLMVPT